MSSDKTLSRVRVPKRQRGRQRVAELLAAATEVFADKGYEAATMTEIATRAGAPIGSLYQFFPSKESLADTLVKAYVDLVSKDLQALEAVAGRVDTQALVASLFGLLRAHPRERAAALPLAEARMDEGTRRATFRHMLRRRIAAILCARAPRLSAEEARELAIVVLQLMKAAGSLSDEEGLPGRTSALRALQDLARQCLDQRLHT